MVFNRIPSVFMFQAPMVIDTLAAASYGLQRTEEWTGRVEMRRKKRAGEQGHPQHDQQNNRHPENIECEGDVS